MKSLVLRIMGHCSIPWSSSSTPIFFTNILVGGFKHIFFPYSNIWDTVILPIDKNIFQMVFSMLNHVETTLSSIDFSMVPMVLAGRWWEERGEASRSLWPRRHRWAAWETLWDPLVNCGFSETLYRIYICTYIHIYIHTYTSMII